MVFRFDGFELDRQRAELRGPGGCVLKLRPKAFEMLQFLVTNAGRALTKQELMETIWPKVFVGEDSLFQCIREIRTVLGDDRRQMVKLATGGGYLFTPAVTIVAADQSPAPGARNQPAPDGTVPAQTQVPHTIFGMRRPIALTAGLAGLCAIAAVSAAALTFRPASVFEQPRPLIALAPIVDSIGDARGTAMASEVSARLTDGFAKIANISVLAPRVDVAGATQAYTSTVAPSYEVTGELQRGEQSWTLRARIVKSSTGEVQSVATASVRTDDLETDVQQSRLAAGVGHPLARRLNEMLEAAAAEKSRTPGSTTKVVIEQAVASIYQTTRERFGMAQMLLQNALNNDPDNVDVAVALAALQMRGIQMVWYTPDEAIAAEEKAAATLERALRAKPNSIAVLETYCRFLSATNHFAESLVTCARTLSFDPWNGLAHFLVGLGQLHLGRFEDALATFRLADRYDTPPVSRWTWLVGAGWAYLVLGDAEAALPWLQRSIAITPATGRTHMLLAAAYQQLGRTEEARAAMQQGLKLRPGTTALTVAPPMKNASPAFKESSDRQIRFMIAAGLPEK